MTTDTPFPGRWVGGTSLVLGPLLVAVGVLLRVRQDFFFPAQLAAYLRHPLLMAASYGSFAAGWVLLCPGVVLLAGRIGGRRPEPALWAGTLTVLGLFARTFHAGVDHLAFRLAADQGAEAATREVAHAYGAFHIFSTLNGAIMAGWALLAFAAWRSGVFGPVRAAALALGSAMPLGVLKGTTPGSLLAAAGLCAALVPYGITVLRTGPWPRPAVAGARIALVTGVAAAMFLLGRAG